MTPKAQAQAVTGRRPHPDSWLIPPDSVQAAVRRFIPRYADPIWSFRALNQNPSVTDCRIHWRLFPDPLREQLRHAAWALVNVPLDDAFLHRYGRPAMRSRLGSESLFSTVDTWRKFALWLDGRGIDRLGEVTADDLADFSAYLCKERGLKRDTVVGYLLTLTRLHSSSAALPLPERLIEPPWVAQGLDDFVPPASSFGENLTEPITPETIGPLLIWALRFVEVFAEDILTASREHSRLIEVAHSAGPVTPGCEVELLAYLEGLYAEGAPVPTAHVSTVTSAAGVYIAALTRTPLEKVYAVCRTKRWRSYILANPGPCPLDVPITGTIDAKPWHTGIEFYMAPILKRHLVTACFIVMAYLTGMRPGELLALESGCCPDRPGTADAAQRHLIYGREFKGARDQDGNHVSAGVERDAPWVAIPQVVAAIRLLERIAGPSLLFAAETHDRRQPELRSGRSLTRDSMSSRIDSFVEWVNIHAAAQGRQAETIPPDPAGNIGLRRFRRTLAWHIARRPGGLVALAVQYGHMRTIISAGYASRSRAGIHDLLDLETARSVAEHLSDVHEALSEGQGVSGPAARRLIHSAATEHQQFGGIIITVRQAKALLADPALNVFENKQAYLTCNWDRSKALCEVGRSGKAEIPSLDRCRSSCANIARTDAHAEAMDSAAAILREQADSGLLPEPIAERKRAKADRLREQAERHRTQRITTSQEET